MNEFLQQNIVELIRLVTEMVSTGRRWHQTRCLNC